MIPTGFYIEDDVFSSAECDDLIRQFQNHSLNRGRAGIRNLMKLEFVSRLASDARLLRIAKLVHGLTMIPYKATLFEKTSKANWLVAWHQDTALPIEKFEPDKGWSAPSRKAGAVYAQAPPAVVEGILALRVHLDASAMTNGPLRVIPGSHRYGVLSNEEIEQFVASVESVECLVGRGGVLAMSPLLLHASSKIKADNPRRVLHIEYAESLDLPIGIRLAIT